jgi:hypothetical protein
MCVRVRNYGHVRGLRLSDAFNCARHPDLKRQERLSNAVRDVARRQFRASQEHLGVTVGCRYDKRLRDPQARSAVENDRLQQGYWIINVENDALGHTCAEFLPDSAGDIEFRGGA